MQAFLKRLLLFTPCLPFLLFFFAGSLPILISRLPDLQRFHIHDVGIELFALIVIPFVANLPSFAIGYWASSWARSRLERPDFSGSPLTVMAIAAAIMAPFLTFAVTSQFFAGE
jgi:hypothetical protein